jgi:hypothetical protein
MTLGCGGYGGNITSDNISPRHLLNIKRLAYETQPAIGSRVSKARSSEPARTSATPLDAEPSRVSEVVDFVSEADVRAAIGEARLVLELMGARYADPAAVTFPELLADSIANQGLFAGPVLSNPYGLSLDSFAIVIDGADGTLITREGRHPDGHPLRPLYWLANFLAAGGYGEGVSLKAGQIVTTGSYCGVVDVPLETALVVRYGDLGTLDVQFSAAG